MGLELCEQSQLLRWMNELPLGVLVLLVDVGEYDDVARADDESQVHVFEHLGHRLTLGLMTVAPFGRASRADRERVAKAMVPLNVVLSRADGRALAEAWCSILVECRPAAAFIPEDALAAVVAEAPSGTVPPVWRPVPKVAG